MANTDVSFIQPALPGWCQSLCAEVEVQLGKKVGPLCEQRAHCVVERGEINSNAHHTFPDPHPKASFILVQEDLLFLLNIWPWK